MGGDYTRFTFKPQRDHAGVLMQQGRVQLDSDWNEWIEMIDRRLLAETLDLAGRRCGVPRTTPEGFLIERDADGRLTIGRGRMYVDGILVENHGSGDPEIEPVWREVRGEDPIPYREQPYLRPPIPATEPGSGTHLVYLDVWRREVTAVEEPAMVERAVGVDTTTRLQTAWAVRCIPNVDEDLRCGGDLSRIGEWVEETRLSGARLTTGTPDPPEEPDPCLIQPTGGYRGIENRLYRVEIHDDGTEAGRPVSFKWSSDNGSVAATIGSIADAATKPRLVVNRLGRDAVLRFRDLDWVELTDDRRESEGRPGVMARVERADEATSTITLIDPLTQTIEMGRNPRVRRWDQRGDRVNAEGLIEIEPFPTEVELEDGIEIRFTLDGTDQPRVGDYWVFAARAADGTVEQLDEALPRGVRHHYCPLAILRADEVDDCRHLFPEECDDCECTVCVTPESHEDRSLTIQAAVDRVTETGGKICLAPGVYEVRRPVRIRRARGIQLAGKGSRSVILHQGSGPAIDVNESYDVTIERLAVASASSGLGQQLLEGTEADGEGPRRRRRRKRPRAPEIGVLIRKTIGVTVERCVLAQSESLFSRREPLAEKSGVAASRSRRSRSRKRPSRAELEERYGGLGSIGIALAGTAIETRIRDNVVFAETGVGMLAIGKTPAPPAPDDDGTEFVAPGRAAAESGEIMGAEPTGPYGAADAEARIATEYAVRAEGSGAAATRRAEREVEEMATLIVEPSGIRELPRYLLTLRLLIEDNVFVGVRAGVDLISLAGGLRTTSLVVHAGETRVAGNSIYRARVGIALIGIVPGAGLVRGGTGLMPTATHGLSSAEGRMMRGDAGIGGIDGSRVEITGNTCALAATGLLVGCDGARIEDNLLTGSGGFPASGIMLLPSMYGGFASGYTSKMRATATAYYQTLAGLRVRGNVISGFPLFGIDAGVYAPVLVKAELTGNGIEGCGTGGITVAHAYGAEISGNQVRGVGSDTDALAVGIALARDFDAARITGNVVAGVGQGTESLDSCIGIAVGVADSVRIAGNRVASIAAPPAGTASGVEIMQGVNHVDVVDNEVKAPDEGDTGADYVALRVESPSSSVRGGLVLLIKGNQLEAAGQGQCVALAGAPSPSVFTLSDNRCLLLSGRVGVPSSVIAISTCGQLIVSSNHVTGGAEVVGISAGLGHDRFTVVGNIVDGLIQIDRGSGAGFEDLVSPWDALNIYP